MSSASTSRTKQTSTDTDEKCDALKIPATVRSFQKQRLQEFLHSLDSCQQVDEDVEEILLEIADKFLDNVLGMSCAIAENRKAKRLEVKDVQLICEKYWGMVVPGYTSDNFNKGRSEEHVEILKKRLKTETVNKEGPPEESSEE